jgi:hypothetical protein
VRGRAAERARACCDAERADPESKTHAKIKKHEFLVHEHKCAVSSATMAPKKSKKSADSINQKLQMVMKSGA